MKSKYRVTTGIYEGHEFNGIPQNISGSERIWDLDSEGRSYPAENCQIIIEGNEAATINNLKSYLTWLVSPQDETEAKIFKENDLIDTHIEIVNKIPSMTKRELIDEINHQLTPYKLEINEKNKS